jgi:uncharacterized membrane protein YhaH (DUF805 family)
MTGQWYYAAGGQQQGPVTVDHLRQLAATGGVQPDTLVWTDGMANWAPLNTTPLFAMLSGDGGAPTAIAPGVASPALSGAQSMAGQAAPWGAGMAGTAAAAQAPGFVDAIKICFAKYATFRGRATRPEYWWFYLAIILVSVLLTIIDVVIFGPNALGLLSLAWSLAVFLPSIAAGVRRLHDTDRSGWWFLIILVPLVGIIVLIVFLAQRGTPGPNRFG